MLKYRFNTMAAEHAFCGVSCLVWCNGMHSKGDVLAVNVSLKWKRGQGGGKEG